MSIGQLRTLVAVQDQASFHGAAASLGITQSAVSMQMRALEERLDLGLFDRSQRPPALTPAARNLVPRAREILALYDSLAGLGKTGAAIAGRLALGTIPSASLIVLPSALARLTALHPDTDLRVESGLSDDLLLRVRSGQLDAALVTEPDSLDRKLRRTTLYSESLVLIAPKAWARRPRRALLADRPFIHFKRRTGVGLVIDRALRQHGIEVRTAMQLDSIEAILTMVAKGLGVAIVPEGAMSERYPGEIHASPAFQPAVRRRVALVSRQREETAGLHEALRAIFRHALGGIEGLRLEDR